jgi:hypothetical protein
MKHLKTFENYNQEELVNEELFGMKEKKFKTDYKARVSSWVKKKKVDKPTTEEREKIFKEAEADKYRGTIMIDKKTNKIFYAASDSGKVKYSSSNETGEGGKGFQG